MLLLLVAAVALPIAAAAPPPSKNSSSSASEVSEPTAPASGADSPLALLTSVGVGYPLTVASGGRYNHYEGVSALLLRTGIVYPASGAVRVALGLGVHRLAADSVVKDDRVRTTVLAFPFHVGLHLRYSSTVEVPLFVSFGYAQRRFAETHGHDATRYLSAGGAARWRFAHALDRSLAFVLAPSLELGVAREGADSNVGSNTMLLLGVSLGVERVAR